MSQGHAGAASPGPTLPTISGCLAAKGLLPAALTPNSSTMYGNSFPEDPSVTAVSAATGSGVAGPTTSIRAVFMARKVLQQQPTFPAGAGAQATLRMQPTMCGSLAAKG